MNHHIKVTPAEFAELKGRKRHIITKPDDYQVSDSLTVTHEYTRDQLTFAIIGTTKLHSRSVVLSLFAPYITENDLPDTVG